MNIGNSFNEHNDMDMFYLELDGMKLRDDFKLEDFADRKRVELRLVKKKRKKDRFSMRFGLGVV